MKIIQSGVCAAKGFSAGGIRCGIKSSSAKKDLALIYSRTPCSAAAVFTTNKVKAAPVIVTQENIKNGRLCAIIANSGNANACTGLSGMKAARRMAELAGAVLLIDADDVAVASTGVIGVPFPVGLIEKNIDKLKENLLSSMEGHEAALEAIMTTDTRKKDLAVEIEIEGKAVHIGAMTKGSGMIHPNMATMLSFIATDANISPALLDTALRHAVNKSFNRLTVDGDTSTNDMALILANGEAGNKEIAADSDNYKIFCDALDYVCIELAKKMARDGEGAAKLITVTVKGAENEKTAEILSKSVASSNLVKTACFGEDANWGRVLCAMGYGAHEGGADFSPGKVSISFESKAGSVQVCKGGEGIDFSEEKAKLVLSEEEIEIAIELDDGDGCATAWGCDLSYDYVKINGDYRT